MLIRTLISISYFAATACLRAQEPFDISLAYSSADLSPYYRAVVRRAADRYRGDANGGMLSGHIHITGWGVFGQSLEIEEVTGDFEATHYYVFRRLPTGARLVLAEAHFLLDPFPAELLTLRDARQTVTRASNQTMKPTATSPRLEDAFGN